MRADKLQRKERQAARFAILVVLNAHPIPMCADALEYLERYVPSAFARKILDIWVAGGKTITEKQLLALDWPILPLDFMVEKHYLRVEDPEKALKRKIDGYYLK